MECWEGVPKFNYESNTKCHRCTLPYADCNPLAETLYLQYKNGSKDKQTNKGKGRNKDLDKDNKTKGKGKGKGNGKGKGKGAG